MQQDSAASPPARFPPTLVPPGIALRVVGDVHGDARAFASALATDRFVVQLGDVVDYGPDSGATLRMALDMVDQGRGIFVLGNHDHKLRRALGGRDVRVGPELAATLRQLDPELRRRAAMAIDRAPVWLQQTCLDGSTRLFVHGAFHTDMLAANPPSLPEGRVHGVLARALYGQTTGRLQADGYPERVLHWVDHIPPGMTVYVGHDRRSTDGRPYIRAGRAGGTAVFLDTGAGKGGHLSWIDLPA
ncbi:MAG: metallophosphoesterase [Aquabacterium sp.]